MLSTSSKQSQHSNKLTVSSFRDSLRELARKDILDKLLKESRKVNQFIQCKPNHEKVNVNLSKLIPQYQPSKQNIKPNQFIPYAVKGFHTPAIVQERYFYQQHQLYNQRIMKPIFNGHKIKTERNGYIVYQKIIGKGTYSKVYEGINIYSKLKVAVKQVQDVMQNQLVCLKGFKSPYIVQMLDYWQQGNKTYIVLEFCQKNLRQAKKNCSKTQFIDYFFMVVEGLNVFVKHNTIHRDIKFQNILIKNKIAKLSDFGLAKPLGSQFIVQSLKCGTPYTMAPQILFNHSDKPLYTIKCDIWSMGILLHQILYDKHPFDYNMQMMAKCKRFNVKKAYPILDEFIDKALIFDQQRRINWPQSVSIFKKYKQSQAKHQIINVNKYTKLPSFQEDSKYLKIQKKKDIKKDYSIKYSQNNWIKQQQHKQEKQPQYRQYFYNIDINKKHDKRDIQQQSQATPRLFVQQKRIKIQKPIIIIQRQNKSLSQNGLLKQRKNKRAQIEENSRQYKKKKIQNQSKTQYSRQCRNQPKYSPFKQQKIKKQSIKKKASKSSYSLDVKSYLLGQGIVIIGALIIYMCL